MALKDKLRKIKRKVKPFAVKALIEANEITKYAEKVTKPKKGKFKLGMK